MMKISTDEGKSWSDDKSLPAGIYGPIKNKPLLMQDGTLLCGTSVENYERWGCYVEYTSDEGTTWNRSNPINLPDDYFGMIQPTLLKLSDKSSLLLLARTRNQKHIAQAFSQDGGRTWFNATLTQMPNPNSGIDAICLNDGRFLLVYNPSKENRFPLSIALSLDQGKTWQYQFNLEDGPW